MRRRRLMRVAAATAGVLGAAGLDRVLGGDQSPPDSVGAVLSVEYDYARLTDFGKLTKGPSRERLAVGPDRTLLTHTCPYRDGERIASEDAWTTVGTPSDRFAETRALLAELTPESWGSRYPSESRATLGTGIVTRSYEVTVDGTTHATTVGRPLVHRSPDEWPDSVPEGLVRLAEDVEPYHRRARDAIASCTSATPGSGPL